MKDTIKQLSKRTGISSDTIRHYRECGIIHPRLRENGYYEYSLDDLLMILLTREMRSMDVSLSGTEEFLERRTMKEFTDWLDERQSELSEQIRLLQLEADRLRETRIYASCGVRLLTQVEEFFLQIPVVHRNIICLSGFVLILATMNDIFSIKPDFCETRKLNGLICNICIAIEGGFCHEIHICGSVKTAAFIVRRTFEPGELRTFVGYLWSLCKRRPGFNPPGI